ncbi:NAD(P)-binding protein [Lophiostoma macrostomum CBS 122681]|uniref:NAD(P)-binding protein n=1 Tax=Lophiostoma macrostomum CBS 122681 TaxID=1314788 RepID=A0A6A6STP5_9PLEO|nr:NAD(P)-binding protein [Lophiostoma macrostomum CBS 122681]
MTILVTGSIGKISSRVASQLQSLSLPILVATRRSPSSIPFPAVTFDWVDKSTYEAPFKHDISAVFIVPPEIQEPAPYVNAFIDVAIAHGVKKYVLNAGTSAAKDGPFVGPVWSYLDTLATSKNIEFAVLRPTWFNENFSELQHQQTIKESSVFYSAAEDGKMPFIGADDIAAAGVAFLAGQKPYENKDHVLLGPQLLTHDEVAKVFSEALGREIRHERKDMQGMVKQYESVGLNALYANFLPYLEVTASQGSQEELFVAGLDETEKLLGRKGINFKDWVQREKSKGYWG